MATPAVKQQAGLSRRQFLATAALAAAGSTMTAAAEEPKLPRVAGVNSIYRFKSHAYHIEGRFLDGYRREGVLHKPPFKLVRMYNDQYPADDMGRGVAQRHGIEICDNVEKTLGGSRLDVDAVLLVCEHGNYPQNELGQILYPRYELFEQIVSVFRRSGRSVPVFVDKHLSYDHQKAAKMVRTAQELKFPLMAGSSLPVTWRRPQIEPPLGSPFTEGLSVFGYERQRVEVYLFHALEVLQCMLERRAGSETGVRSVRTIEGDAVWRAGDEGLWSWKLLEAALSRCPSCNVGPVKTNVTNPQAVLVEYRDGTKGAVLNVMEQTSDLAFAGQLKGAAEPISSCFYLPAPPGARFFDPLVWNIEKFFTEGRPPYPVERTLLTSTVLDFALRSLHEKGQTQTSDALDIRYQAPAESGFFRGRFTDA